MNTTASTAEALAVARHAVRNAEMYGRPGVGVAQDQIACLGAAVLALAEAIEHQGTA